MGWVGLDLYVCGLGWVVGYENGPMDNSAVTSNTVCMVQSATPECPDVTAGVDVCPL